MLENSIKRSFPRTNKILDILGQLIKSRTGLLGLLFLTPVLVGSVFAPIIAPFDPTATHAADAGLAPGGEYLLGTDHLGRDLFSRILYGGRTSLVIASAATLLSLIIGTPVGIIAAYQGGIVDEVVMRLMDALLSIPSLILALLVVATLPESNKMVIVAISVPFIPRISRIIRGKALSIKNEEYITAAESRGESAPYIWFGEIMPNTVDIIVIEGSIRIGFAIVVTSSLSFLGLGTQPPHPDWGYMVSTSQEYLWQTPYPLLWPALALMITILGFNLLGDGLRDVLDPESTR